MDRALADPADSKARLAVGVEPVEEIHTQACLSATLMRQISSHVNMIYMIIAGFWFLI